MGIVDIDALLTEIAPDSPSGEDIEYDADFIALEQKAKGAPEQQIGDRIEPAQPPNWREIRRDASALLQRSHDLRLLLHLIRALIHTDGYAGLHEGLLAVHGTLQKYWDSVHPQLDPDDGNDPTQRINILLGLCDFETILRPVSLAPLVESRSVGRFSLRDVQIASGKLPAVAGDEAPPSLATIQAAFSEADADGLLATKAAVDGAVAGIDAIDSTLTDYVGISNAPEFSPLRALLKDAQSVLAEHLGRLSIGSEPLPEAEGGEVPVGGVAAAPGKGGQIAGINNRQDVVRTLELICDYYAKNEPSSPVPLLLHRAKRLVTMDFMELMENLAPDGLSQIKLLKGPDADA